MTVRALYAELGIELPARSTREAPVRCFAQPDGHRHGDRSPSCSVNLESGAWNCHGCGAHGGAYDAALATGHSPRSAMELLIAHDLADPRVPARAPRRERTDHDLYARPATPVVIPPLAADEQDVQQWVEMLDANSRLIRQLALKRGWGLRTIRELQLGFDGVRITIPIRAGQNALRGVLRYDPFGRREPKMLAVTGTRLGLTPHPSQEASDRVILVEGLPDMVAARSCGLPAIAVPGTHAWQPAWARLLTGRTVAIVMDCDRAGRRAAAQISKSLRMAGIGAETIDLWPDRSDGYDLTDRILDRRRARPGARSAGTVASLLRPAPLAHPKRTRAATRPTQEAER